MAQLANLIAGNINTQTNLKRSTVTKSNIQNRIQIGSGVVNEIDLPEVWETNLIYSGGNDSFILGHATNGKLGSPQLGVGGNQIVLGDYSTSYAVQRIINPPDTAGLGKIWYWLLTSLENTYWVLVADTTATVTANTSIGFTAGQTFRSNNLSTESSNITRATLLITASNITGAGNLTYYLSANGGTNWEAVSLNTEYTFLNAGTNLRLRIDASGAATIALKATDLVRTPIGISYQIT